MYLSSVILDGIVSQGIQFEPFANIFLPLFSKYKLLPISSFSDIALKLEKHIFFCIEISPIFESFWVIVNLYIKFSFNFNCLNSVDVFHIQGLDTINSVTILFSPSLISTGIFFLTSLISFPSMLKLNSFVSFL